MEHLGSSKEMMNVVLNLLLSEVWLSAKKNY
jgi:hypothetical protein